MNTDSFRDKTVIITGASAGVGAACARAFAAQKAKLVLVARGVEALDAIAKELLTETDVLAISMDVSDTGSCIKLLERAEQVFGAVHCLINNAGAHLPTPEHICAGTSRAEAPKIWPPWWMSTCARHWFSPRPLYRTCERRAAGPS
jgi:NADP-dependent 3-hydroxy acid dehydrogenase YdfG